MEDQRTGAALRLLRIKRNWRQSDLAKVAGVSAATISRLERGHFAQLSLATMRAVGAALDMRLDVVPRWRGGDLDRLLNARHSAMHEAVAQMFAELPGWAVAAEVSFAVYAERGIVDVLGWHAATRTLLVVELKTELVDVQEVLGTLDRKRRLAPVIGRERGWAPAQVAVWLLLAESTTNRDSVRGHRAVLRGAYPAGGLEMRRWLQAPSGQIRALSFLGGPSGGRHGRIGAGDAAQPPEGAGTQRSPLDGAGAKRVPLRNGHGRNAMSSFAPRKRVRVARGAPGVGTHRHSGPDSCGTDAGAELVHGRVGVEQDLEAGTRRPSGG
jgi:transcriptional regulator with XRE-family HTH domain